MKTDSELTHDPQRPLGQSFHTRFLQHDNSRFPLVSELTPYIRLRPVGAVNAIRLYLAFGISLLARMICPSRFESIGHLIPGGSRLTIFTDGVFARVRPGTSDLGMIAGVLEPETTTWFQVHQEDIVLDIGAHIGRYTLVAAQRGSFVVSVEPVPSNFAVLQENVKLNRFKNVLPLRLAISDRQGKIPLYLSQRGDTATSSLESRWSERLKTTTSHESLVVDCETLDKLVTTLWLKSISWVKIDVEGHEVSVLRGAEMALRTTKNLILEVAAGNEEICREITERCGLKLIATETQRGGLVANWLLTRRYRDLMNATWPEHND